MVVATHACPAGLSTSSWRPVLPATLVHVFGGGADRPGAGRRGRRRLDTPSPRSPIPSHRSPDDTAAVVVASHGRDEEKVLARALAAPVPYVGLVASHRRGTAVVSELDVPEDPAQRSALRPGWTSVPARRWRSRSRWWPNWSPSRPRCSPCPSLHPGRPCPWSRPVDRDRPGLRHDRGRRAGEPAPGARRADLVLLRPRLPAGLRRRPGAYGG